MTHGKDATSEAHALQAVEGHHADMLKELNVLVGLLTTAVQAGDAAAEETAQTALLDWCDTVLIPHALAEEGPSYGVGSPELSLAESVKGLHELTGEGAGNHPPDDDGAHHH